MLRSISSGESLPACHLIRLWILRATHGENARGDFLESVADF